MKFAHLFTLSVVVACGACRASKSTPHEAPAAPSASAHSVSPSSHVSEANARSSAAAPSSAAASGTSWLPWPAPDAAELQSGQREASFAMAVAQHLSAAEGDRAEPSSFVFAPVSLAAVLALSYEAARGTTRAEIGKALGLNGVSDTEGARSLARLAEFATPDPRFRTKHGTALRVAPSVTPHLTFRERARAEYHVAFLSGKPGESPTSAINDWLKSTMGASAQLLLGAEGVRADARFVIADFVRPGCLAHAVCRGAYSAASVHGRQRQEEQGTHDDFRG